MKKFQHNKTGKLYELAQDPCKVKQNGIWSDFILYKALYDNPDGPYFVRTKEDFYNNFTEVTMEDDGNGNICG